MTAAKVLSRAVRWVARGSCPAAIWASHARALVRASASVSSPTRPSVSALALLARIDASPQDERFSTFGRDADAQRRHQRIADGITASARLQGFNECFSQYPGTVHRFASPFSRHR